MVLKYEPLADPAREIRLLRFLPAERRTDDGPLMLALTTVALTDAPVYNAISYTWGTECEARVVVNGQWTTVRKSCWSALLQARAHHSDDFCWIDSICINQSDEAEKSQQVQIMWEIYENAHRVLSCVGTGDEESRSLATVVAEIENGLNDSREKSSTLQWLISLGEIKVARLCNLLQNFAAKPYFGRLWVVQEIAAAQRVSILCGDDFFSFRAVDLLCELLGDPLMTHVRNLGWNRVQPGTFSPLETVILRKDMANMEIGWAFTNFGDFGCTDPRDRLYGLLHLIQWPQHVLPIQADYEKNTFHLALEICAFINPYRTEDMLKALMIDFNHPEMRALVESRNIVNQGTLGSGEKAQRSINLFDPWVDMKRTGDNTNLLEFTTCAELYLNDNGDLSAILQVTPEVNGNTSYLLGSTSTINYALEQFWKTCHPALALISKPKALFTGSEIVGLVPGQALPGDVLVHFGQRYHNILLILRRKPVGLYDIVGQGISVNGYALVPAESPSSPISSLNGNRHEASIFEAIVELKVTGEDLLFLHGQNIGVPNDNLRSRLHQLVTRPITFPLNAAKVTKLESQTSRFSVHGQHPISVVKIVR